ncbi:MAG TPA: PDZ domain-containing protein [Gemmatimonadaceae bacterium]|nr:PDZ domain-containing protein [Gemmatimonadaceae bacterium]
MSSFRSRFALPCLALAAAAAPLAAQSGSNTPLLLQQPALSRTQVVFAYAGDLWTVPREGGDARRLTTGAGNETHPSFSPDGSLVAFTGEYEGNADVYVVPVEGGVPRRLTYHPAPDEVVGWAPDGKRVLFRSFRSSFSRFPQLYTVSRDGGPATAVPLPSGYDGAYSPDGASLAYLPSMPANEIWKRYRGGQTSRIWLARLKDAHVDTVPRANSNDANPMWVGGKVYFISDRSGPATLFAYDTATKQVSQVVPNDETPFEVKSASAGPGGIVYERFGSMHLLDLASGKSSRLAVRVAGDLPQLRPRFVRVANRVRNVALSPSGVRVAFEARGEILTAPTDKGDPRDVTNTVNAAERDPSWSPDGRWIAYFSDAGGEYALHLRDQSGMGADKRIALGDGSTNGSSPGFFYSPRWSPDSKRIAYLDNRLGLWTVDVATGKNTRVDADSYESPWRGLDPAWSPDGRWLAYTKQLKNHLRALFLYSLETGKATQVTDGMSDARYAAFDRGGKYLYFTASTNAGPSSGWLDMSSYDRPITRAAYLVVLRKDLPSPLAPLSDEEKVAAANDSAMTSGSGESGVGSDGKKKTTPHSPLPTPVVRVDLQDIDQRILALPTPARDYSGVEVGKPGVVFLLETVQQPAESAEQPTMQKQTLHKYDMTARKFTKVVEGIGGYGPGGNFDGNNSTFRVSANGEKMLYAMGGGRWVVSAAGEAPKPGEGVVKTDEMMVQVDPRAEWTQMYGEVWRIERDFFYDPKYHGLDLAKAAKKYEPFVSGVASRADLNYLFDDMLGELTVGHLFVNGGDEPEGTPWPRTGLLGADYDVANGRYRFARVLAGENWNPTTRSPLTAPGVNVREGEYLLAVDGRDVRADSADVYAYFQGTANKSVVLRVGPNPTLAGSREVTVVPLASEGSLRNLAWIDANRRTVDRLSGGRVAYVYLPNTAGAGYTNFNRYYFAQVDRDGAVIDERFNGGGSAADYMIDAMRRPLMSRWRTRAGEDFTTPVAAIFGPKAMIINEYAGSGGDALPWYFRQAKLGPLVGKRTWGGLVGIYDYPPLMDGGSVTAPRVAFRNVEGEFDVENKGVAPDVEVELDPAAWRAGHDPQLERAVAEVMDALKKAPPVVTKRGGYPNYQTGGGTR